jgi:prepilin-type N-terminal cleavage/methylation domain-containing protein
MKKDAGFTLLEVMIAMLIGTIGLLGTIAVQQSIINASKNANDAAIAMRLATQKLEEIASRNTDDQNTDLSIGLFPMVNTADPAAWSPTDSGGAAIPEQVDAEGYYLRDAGGVYARLPTPSELGRYRWQRRWKVVNTGIGLPYVVSVIVTYFDDNGTPKTTRLDMERRKSW